MSRNRRKTVTENGPPEDRATWKVVMPPARMQMIEKEMAKFEKPFMRRASSCAYPMEWRTLTSSS
jgi:hypothetical protein